MKILAIDQSLSSCAIVVLDNGDPVFKEVLRTSRLDSKKPDKEFKENVKVFSRATEQMRYISDSIATIATSFNVEHVITEALSLNSIGNATRDLAGLFHCVQLTLLMKGFKMDQIHEVTPTAVKAIAWNYLPEEVKYDGLKKDGKPRKRKMDKNEMILACEQVAPELLEGFTKTGKNGGRGDLADAYWIGRYMHERSKPIISR